MKDRTPAQFRRTAVLWFAAGAAFVMAALGHERAPLFWLVAALFVLNGGIALHRAGTR